MKGGQAFLGRGSGSWTAWEPKNSGPVRFLLPIIPCSWSMLRGVRCKQTGKMGEWGRSWRTLWCKQWHLPFESDWEPLEKPSPSSPDFYALIYNIMAHSQWEYETTVPCNTSCLSSLPLLLRHGQHLWACSNCWFSLLAQIYWTWLSEGGAQGFAFNRLSKWSWSTVSLRSSALNQSFLKGTGQLSRVDSFVDCFWLVRSG